MDGFGQVGGHCAHLDGQHGFGDHLAGVRPGYTHTEHATGLGLEDDLGHTFRPTDGWTSGFDLAADVDLLIHDAQYSPDEYAAHAGWGHSSFAHSVAFAEAARAKQLVMFHHDTSHDDDTLDTFAEQAAELAESDTKLTVAAEGTTFDLSA